MTKSLPPNPSPKHLRLEAKALLKAHRTGDASCCEVLRHLHPLRGVSNEQILTAVVGLQDVQFALAMAYGFTDWTEMKRTVQNKGDTRQLHVTWDTALAEQLRDLGLGDTAIWQDPVNEGPAPSGLSYEEWWYVRRRFWFESGVVPREPERPKGLSEMDKRLAQYPEYDEVVLWSDPCLFDQCILIRNLDWFSERDMGNTRLSVVCEDECPVPVISESPEKAHDFLARRKAVTDAQFEVSRAAWRAYRSPDPRAVEALIAGGTPALPYLADALKRHLERFPSLHNGLCRYERESLEAVKDGPVALPFVQMRVMAMEERPFGDSEFVDGVRRMVLCDEPLLSAAGPDVEGINTPGDEWTLSLTPLGEGVLAGAHDFVRLGGIDRWIGGVHLQGREAAWRWSDDEHRLVARR